MFSTSWITMLSCEIRRRDKEDRLRQEFQKFQSDQNDKHNAKTRLKFYMFLKPEGKFNIKVFISLASVLGLLHSRCYKICETGKSWIKKNVCNFQKRILSGQLMKVMCIFCLLQNVTMDHGLKTKHRLRYKRCWKLFMIECSTSKEIQTDEHWSILPLKQTAFSKWGK